MRPPLAKRLGLARGRPSEPAADVLDPGSPETDDRALMAQCLAYLYGGSALLGLVSIVFFEAAPGVDRLGLLATCGLSLFVAGITVAGYDRLSLRTLHMISGCGTVLVALAIYFNGDPTNDNELFYVLVTIFIFYFFTPVQAALQLAGAFVAYGAALVAIEGSDVDPTRWVIALGVLAVAGGLVRTLKGRMQSLVERLADAARSDALTGLLNRRGWRDCFDRALACRSEGESLTLLMGDLDQFKALNDTGGHQAGDRALQRVAEIMSRGAPDAQCVARIGGEEFALILPAHGVEAATTVAEGLRADVADEFGDSAVALTVSFGVATCPEHGRSVEELLRAADQALYAAKELGRNRSVAYSSEVSKVLVGAAGRRLANSQGHLATMLSLAEAIDLRDTGTAQHSQTVGRYAEAMATALGLPEGRVERVRLAGLLHDIGKIGVPDAVLRKPGPLGADEWASMRKHPETGARILESTTLEDIRRWVLAHHERPDGNGYPYGLTATDLPIEARILAVADAWEAMTSDRVYRPALERVDAVAELRRYAGTQFDPEVVEALLHVVAQEPASAHPSRGTVDYDKKVASRATNLPVSAGSLS